MNAPRRFPLAVLVLSIALFAAWLAPAGAQAAGLFVLSGSDSSDPTHSLPGLISLADAGGESQSSTSGGAVIAGTGVGPYVYNSGGTGSIRQFSGGTYHTLTNSIPSVSSMTMTGRGLVVAIGNKLQYVASNGTRSDVPHGTLAGGDSWVAIATAPDGHVIGWSWNDGWGELWDLNLGTGATTSQDYTGTLNDPFFDNRDNVHNAGAGPIPNAGDIAVDGLGGLWVAGVGLDGSNAQIYYGPSGGSPNSVATGYYKPHVTATGDGKAYASTSDYSFSPYLSDVYKFSPAEGKITSSSGKLTNSALFDLAVDRCYTSCSVTGPGGGGGGGGGGGAGGGSGSGSGGGSGGSNNTGTTSSPLTTAKVSGLKNSAKLGKKGIKLKLKCSAACTITVSGKLVYGKKSKHAVAASNTVKKAKIKLKAGKAKSLTLKLSKSQRRKIKKALRKKRKVTAKLKVTVKSKGLKTLVKHPKLRIK